MERLMAAPLDFEVNTTLDTSGLLCPEPVMMLHRAMSEISEGEILEVIATDPSTQRDIPKFCNFLHHTLLHQIDKPMSYHYFIKKC